MGRLTIHNVRLVDGTGAPPRDGCAIRVDAGRIAWVGAADEAPAGAADGAATVVDGTGMTLLPGLIDCHVHLSLNGGPDAAREAGRTPAEEALDALANAAATLAKGVTTVRDCGGSIVRSALALSRRTDRLGVPLPRIVPCGTFITMTGGHVHWEAVEADGPDELRKAVRAEVKAGAAWIKIMATGGVLTPGTDIGAPSYTEEELAAAVATAHHAGRRVAAHAIGTEGIKNALRAGADSIEHGSFLDDEAIELLLARGAAHVSTLSAYHQVATHGVAGGIADDAVRKAVGAKGANEDSFRRSLAAGVRLAAGTDAGTPYNAHGALPGELRLMVECGASPGDAIRFATGAAADTLGIGGDVGTIETGKAADLVLVADDPLEDITCLEHPDVVIRAGRVCVASPAGRRAFPGAATDGAPIVDLPVQT